MAFSFTQHTGDGATTTFTFSFVGPGNGYYEEDQIKVYVDDVETSFTLSGPNQITLASAPANGSSICIKREPDITNTYTDWIRGNVFGRDNINRSFQQLLYLIQRIQDGFKEDGYYQKQDMNLGGFRITNLAEGVDDTDAVNKEQMDAVEAIASSQVDQAALYASQAEASAASAATSEENASTWEAEFISLKEAAEIAAGTSSSNANLAEQWATEDEDVEITPGKFSALHYAAKAEEALAGFSVSSVFDTVALMKAEALTVGNVYETKGYYSPGDGGGGKYLIKTSAQFGATPDEYGDHTVNTTDVAVLLENVIYSLQFGCKRDEVYDNSPNMAAMANAIHAGPSLRRCVFQEGVYSYSVSPNWAIQDAVITSEGQVILDYTGSDIGVVLSADAPLAVTFTPGLCYNTVMGPFFLGTTAATTKGVLFESMHHGSFEFNFLGGCTAGPAFEVGFSVLSEYKLTCSVNVGGWYGGNKPDIGVRLRKRGTAEEPSYCMFYNPVIEGPNVGIYCVDGLGNIFIGGTSEGCSDTGLIFALGCYNNRCIGTDFEANVNNDIIVTGYANELINVDTYTKILLAGEADSCVVNGGSHSNIVIDPGAVDNKISNLKYNRFSNSSTISDLGTRTRMSNLLNLQTRKHHNCIPSNTGLTPTGSPFTYKNTTGNNVVVDVTGGTVQGLGILHAGVFYGSSLNGQYTLFPEDSISIEYTAAPSIRLLKG